MLRLHRLLPAIAVAVPLVGATTSPVTAAPTYTVSLSASPTTLETGESTTLTTTTSHDLTGTRWTTYVFDQTDPTWYRTCKVQTCSFSVAYHTPGSHTFIAYVARDRSDPRYPPMQIQATSNTVTVTWTTPTFTVTLASDDAWVPPGTTAVIMARSNKDMTGRPFAIQVFDLTSNERVAFCATGSTCPAFVSQSTPTTHAYQAFVAEPGDTPPPPNVQASSEVLPVTWSVLPDPTRPPNVGGGPITGTVTFSPPGVPPLDEQCEATHFDFAGSSQTAWVNGSGKAYLGPLTLSGSGGSDCEHAGAGSGTLTLSAAGRSDVGSLQCGPLEGSYTRALTDMTVAVSGDCEINGFEVVRVSFVAKVEVRPTNDDGGIDEWITAAEFAGTFAVIPD